MDNWNALKSGTDLRGTASGEATTLTPERCRQAAAAFAALVRESGIPAPLKIAVGRDPRHSGPSLARAAREGLAAADAAVLDVGLCTTPAMFMTTYHPATQCDAAIMVTASHLPAERNGLKFITRAGGLDSKGIDRLLAIAEALSPIPPREDASERLDFLPHYRTSLSGLAGPVRFDGLRIVVDAGNGSGGFYADWLRSLGADTSGSQCLDPDGAFPNHAPNPEDPAAMASLAGAVRAARADLGVLFDADCDRAALVLSDGTPVNRDRLIYLSAAMVLAEHPGGTIVTDSVTGDHLTRAIEALGGVHHRFKRGYRNIIDEAKRLNAQGVDCPLAIETSGHAALRENHYLDDGMYLVTRLLIHAARHSLADALAHLPEPLETAELRIPIRAQDFHKEGQAALNQVETWLRASAYRIDPKNLEGIRAQTPEGDGWFLLRLSLHDPLLVWNAQSDKKDGISALWGDTAQALQGLEVTLP